MKTRVSTIQSAKLLRVLSVVSGLVALLVTLYYYLSKGTAGSPLPYLPTHYYHLIVVPFLELGLVSILADWSLITRNRNKIYWSILVVVAFNSALYLGLFPIYTHPDILNKFGIQNLHGLFVWLRFAAIAAPFLVLIYFEVVHFQLLSPLYSLVSQFTEGEKLSEITEENSRRENFNARYPKISNVPVLNGIFEKVYAEGVWYVLGFVGFVFLGFYLRILNPGGLSPHIDEFSHMFAAKAIFEGASINSVYSRSLFVVTLPVLLSYKLFGVSILAAKYAAIFGNTLAMLPLYGLLRRVNKKTAILGVALYATSPWVILVGRIVREYSFHPFVTLLLSIAFIKIYESLPEDFSFTTGWVVPFLQKAYFELIIVAAFPCYVLYVDPNASIKYLLGIYFAFLLSLAFYKSDIRIKKRHYILGIIGPVVVLWFVVSRFSAFISEQPKVVWYYFGLLVNNPIQQWYYVKAPFLELAIISISLIALLASLSKKNNFVITFSWANLAILLSFYTLLFDRYDRPRYIFIMEIWFIIIIAVGGLVAFSLLTYRLKGRLFRWLVALTMAVVFVNASHIWNVVNDSEPRINPISGEIHYDVQGTHNYFMENKKPGDVLIGGYFLSYVTMMEGESVIKDFVYFSPATQEKAVIEAAIKANPSGWVIFDKDRGEKWYQPLPLEDFIVEDVEVDYLGRIGDFFLYRWGEN